MRLDPPLPPTHLGKLRELPLLLLLRMLRLDQIPEARAIDYCLQEGVSLIACKAERRRSHRSQGSSLEGSQRPPLWSRTSTPKGHRFVLVGQVLEVGVVADLAQHSNGLGGALSQGARTYP